VFIHHCVNDSLLCLILTVSIHVWYQKLPNSSNSLCRSFAVSCLPTYSGQYFLLLVCYVMVNRLVHSLSNYIDVGRHVFSCGGNIWQVEFLSVLWTEPTLVHFWCFRVRSVLMQCKVQRKVLLIEYVATFHHRIHLRLRHSCAQKCFFF
jgi:hypothetical protein